MLPHGPWATMTNWVPATRSRWRLNVVSKPAVRHPADPLTANGPARPAAEGGNERSGWLLLVWGRVKGDVVEQGCDEGEEQEGQRQHEDHADHHQGENGVVGPH